jgi:hypothetical protein
VAQAKYIHLAELATVVVAEAAVQTADIPSQWTAKHPGQCSQWANAYPLVWNFEKELATETAKLANHGNH